MSLWPIVIALAMTGTAAIPIAIWAKPRPVHEIRLVVRAMTYYVDGEHVPNPTLRLKRGEQVRVVLRNEDDGMSHDVAIGTWGITVEALHGRGERSVSFRVPDGAGETGYACTAHSKMMRGSIVVE